MKKTNRYLHHSIHVGAPSSAPRQTLVALVAMLALMFAALPIARAIPTGHDIAAGWVEALQDPVDDTQANCTLLYSMNGFKLTTFNRGDYSTQIGTDPSDDWLNGVMLSSVAQNVRTNYGTNNYGISMVETNGDGSFRLVAFKAGGENAELNINLVGAYFPFATWLGGQARTEPYLNGGTNNFFIGSPGLQLGVNFIDYKGLTNGWYRVDLRDKGYNSLTDGVLIVNHGKDRSGDGNYAESYAADDGTWLVRIRDHDASGEADPVNFVFIPKTNTTVICGKFRGSGEIVLHSGATAPFTISPNGGGRWLLNIPGHSPANGILLIAEEMGGSQNGDNIVTYEPLEDMSGWQIQSRDLPGCGLQTPGGGNDTICSFVYIPGPTPGITVKPVNNVITTEAGGMATFTVVLDSKPTGDVTVSVSSSDTSEGITDVNSLVFTPANWDDPQTVTVIGQDDPDKDGSVPYTIVLSAATSTDPAYNGFDPADVSAVNLDNEPGITLSKNAVTTTEAGGSDNFTVVLNTAPTADVTINLSSSDIAEGTVSPASLTFTTLDWNSPKTVTVAGVEDSVADGNVAYTIVTAAATSIDPDYNGVNALDVAAVNLDNDHVGIVFSPSSGISVSEPNTTAPFTVVLTSEPTADVMISFASSDTSEGTVSPASRTFTAANWATPQSFTLTAADDNVNDGTVTYNLNGTVTSSEAAYAALTPVLPASTADNEATLTLPSGPLLYGTLTPPKGIDTLATLSDPDTANYNSGSLTVALTVNGTSDDRLGIRNTGTGAGEIGVSGSSVTYGGVSIGTFSGGTGTTPLVVSFNAAATPEAAQALIRNITFENVNSNPSIALRTVVFTLADGVGGTTTAATYIKVGLLHLSEFQEGVDHGFGVYSGEVDVEINSLDYTTSFPAGSDLVNGLVLSSDPNNVILMRFENLVGTGPGQIPPNSIIVSADLVLQVNDGGYGGEFHRMLVPWSGTDSWDSIGSGIQTDDVEATSTYDSLWGNTSAGSGAGPVTIGVIPDVQAWVNGTNNFGWAMVPWIPSGSANSVIFSPSEASDSAARPRLLVKWVPAGTASASFRYGVNGYTAAHDTCLRESSPDDSTTFATNTILFVDGEVTGGKADPGEVLMRFDDIVGSGAGQIPAGATVHVAVLDLDSSSVGAGVGDGGTFHVMLRPWQDTDTWNSLDSGIFADNIESLPTPTAWAGDASLNPNVQMTHLTFELTPDVQAWVNGARPNYGWAMLPWTLGGDGWGFNTAEAATEASRPQLRVYYSAGVVNNLTMLPPIYSPGSVQVRFSGTPNTSYAVERAPAVTGSWTQLGTATTGSDGKASYTDNAPLSSAAFYRAKQ